MSHSKDLILLLGVFVTVLRDFTAYQMMRLVGGAPQVPAKSAEQAFSLLNTGGSSLSLDIPAPQDLSSSIQTLDPWVDTCGG
jgi:hypothetical protein